MKQWKDANETMVLLQQLCQTSKNVDNFDRDSKSGAFRKKSTKTDYWGKRDIRNSCVLGEEVEAISNLPDNVYEKAFYLLLHLLLSRRFDVAEVWSA